MEDRPLHPARRCGARGWSTAPDQLAADLPYQLRTQDEFLTRVARRRLLRCAARRCEGATDLALALLRELAEIGTAIPETRP